jgi:hypothetical protein
MSVFCPLKSSPTSLPECSSALADARCGGAWPPMLPGMSTGAKTAPPLGSPSSILCRHWLWCLGLGGIGVDRRRQNHSTSRVSFFHSLLTLALATWRLGLGGTGVGRQRLRGRAADQGFRPFRCVWLGNRRLWVSLLCFQSKH